MRLSGIPNDVVASDGRYHAEYKRNFCLRIATVEQKFGDSSFLELVRAIKADKSRIWNSVELFNRTKETVKTFRNSNVHQQLIKTL